jgi:hypothetical protein
MTPLERRLRDVIERKNDRILRLEEKLSRACARNALIKAQLRRWIAGQEIESDYIDPDDPINGAATE